MQFDAVCINTSLPCAPIRIPLSSRPSGAAISTAATIGRRLEYRDACARSESCARRVVHPWPPAQWAPRRLRSCPAGSRLLRAQSAHCAGRRRTTTIDFGNTQAVAALNSALMAVDYGIAGFEIPPDTISPGIPGPTVHLLADLLSDDCNGVVPRGEAVRGLDIGCGASCVYPLLGRVWMVVRGKRHQRALSALARAESSTARASQACIYAGSTT